MIYVLDTNAWADVLRGAGRIGRKLSVTPMARIRLAAPVLYELRRGATGAAEKLKAAIDALASTYEIASLDEDAAEAAAHIAMEARARGRQVHHLDALIAGIAVAQRAVLVTRDADFANLGGLDLENWSDV
jgi:predicted nucleic acid-binding protein